MIIDDRIPGSCTKGTDLDLKRDILWVANTDCNKTERSSPRKPKWCPMVPLAQVSIHRIAQGKPLLSLKLDCSKLTVSLDNPTENVPFCLFVFVAVSKESSQTWCLSLKITLQGNSQTPVPHQVPWSLSSFPILVLWFWRTTFSSLVLINEKHVLNLSWSYFPTLKLL